MYLPNINLVWASMPGRAEKKKPATGIKINSKGVRRARQRGKVLGRFGL